MRRRRIGLLLGALAVLAVIIMWVAAFAGWGSTESIDQLADERWTSEAREICADRRAEFDELPGASSAETPQDRADIVNNSIDVFTQMTDQLAAIDPPSNPEEAALVTEWLGDWDRHLDDRSRFVGLLEQGREDAVYTESLRDDKQVSRYIDRFARVNDMNLCGTPEDV